MPPKRPLAAPISSTVPNAGFQHVSPAEEFDEDRWDALLALLLTSPFLLARYGWDRIAECTLAVYDEVLAEHAGRPVPSGPDELPDDRDDHGSSHLYGVAR